MPETPETIWKSQEDQTMQLALTPDRLAAMCQSRERLNRGVHWCLMAVLAFSAASALYNVFTLAQPWMRLGQVWAIGAFIYLLTPALHAGPPRQGAGEPSAEFLIRQHELRRDGFRWIRRRVFLLLPSIIFSWVGVRELNPQAAYWPPFAGAACLIVLSHFLGKGAENKAQRDADEIRRALH
jgi:membrane protease YdiL (CAAX protease family)